MVWVIVLYRPLLFYILMGYLYAARAGGCTVALDHPSPFSG